MTGTMLHIGCGRPGKATPVMFHGCEELRMDIDPAVEPDVVGDITAIDLPDGAVDAVYASHVLEHVEPWLVGQALAECWRVLAPDGEMIVVTPDLAAWAAEIVAHPELVEVRGATGYPAPVSMLDALYGFGPDVQAGSEAMRHRTGFTAASLSHHLAAAGFEGRIAAGQWQLCAWVRKNRGWAGGRGSERGIVVLIELIRAYGVRDRGAIDY